MVSKAIRAQTSGSDGLWPRPRHKRSRQRLRDAVRSDELTIVSPESVDPCQIGIVMYPALFRLFPLGMMSKPSSALSSPLHPDMPLTSRPATTARAARERPSWRRLAAPPWGIGPEDQEVKGSAVGP
jgi:hypothetical protein